MRDDKNMQTSEVMSGTYLIFYLLLPGTLFLHISFTTIIRGN